MYSLILLIWKFRGVAQPGSARRSGRRGQEFESPHPDKTRNHPENYFYMHYVYILQSKKDGKYYIGYTSNLESRLAYHNSGQQRSTKHRIPFEMVYFEKYETRREALKREKEIKSYKGGNAFCKLLQGV